MALNSITVKAEDNLGTAPVTAACGVGRVIRAVTATLQKWALHSDGRFSGTNTGITTLLSRH